MKSSGTSIVANPLNSIVARAYRPAEGGERACNSRTASTEGEMLAVTKFRTEICHVRARHNVLIYRPYKETANVFLLTASISPSVLAVWELHALSPPSSGRYALDSRDNPHEKLRHFIMVGSGLRDNKKCGCEIVLKNQTIS